MIIYADLFGLAVCTVVSARMYRHWRMSTERLLANVAIGISAVGVLGFFAAVVWIGSIPSRFIDRVELPNSLGAVRLVAPDGHVFVVSIPAARVQRYGPEGFEKGFMYHRKAFAFGMAASGNVLICATADELLTFSPEGAEILPRGKCGAGFEWPTSTYVSEAKVPRIAFNWLSVLAVPLWHPWVACAFAIVGGLLLQTASEGRSDAARDQE
jgi:hypothetical protein